MSAVESYVESLMGGAEKIMEWEFLLLPGGAGYVESVHKSKSGTMVFGFIKYGDSQDDSIYFRTKNVEFFDSFEGTPYCGYYPYPPKSEEPLAYYSRALMERPVTFLRRDTKKGPEAVSVRIWEPDRWSRIWPVYRLEQDVAPLSGGLSKPKQHEPQWEVAWEGRDLSNLSKNYPPSKYRIDGEGKVVRHRMLMQEMRYGSKDWTPCTSDPRTESQPPRKKAWGSSNQTKQGDHKGGLSNGR